MIPGGEIFPILVRLACRLVDEVSIRLQVVALFCLWLPFAAAGWSQAGPEVTGPEVTGLELWEDFTQDRGPIDEALGRPILFGGERVVRPGPGPYRGCAGRGTPCDRVSVSARQRWRVEQPTR